MNARHDFLCLNCSQITEFIGEPDCVCHHCGNTSWQLVFTEVPQIRTEHASTIDYLIEQNNKIGDQIDEEDSNPSSPIARDMREAMFNTRGH